MAERTPSASTVATYVSFDLQAPRTPADERERRDAELRRARCSRSRWWWSRCRAASAERDGNEEEEGEDEEARAGETTALLRPSGRKEGQTRTEYVLGEVWCYARVRSPLSLAHLRGP